jgi:hypothetical protein
MADEKLTLEESAQFLALLRRYCAYDLDQWELWKTDTPYGTVFISLRRVLEEGTPAEMYDSIDRS